MKFGQLPADINTLIRLHPKARVAIDDVSFLADYYGNHFFLKIEPIGELNAILLGPGGFISYACVGDRARVLGLERKEFVPIFYPQTLAA